jgi:hypothetical protein
MTIKLGIVGASDGNGHPYSWSAIFNGYDAKHMQDCGYPVIPNYLGEQKWPESKIKDAKVVSVLTQDYEISKKISKSSLIPDISNDIYDMINKVDAILLARDDSENHIKIVKPCLENGMPIYIDKPIALSLMDLSYIYDLEKYSGQIFTCSALRYSDELNKKNIDLDEIGKIIEIEGFTPKSWDKYAIHIIEPILNIISANDKIVKSNKYYYKDTSKLMLDWSSGLKTSFNTLGNIEANLYLKIIGTKRTKKLIFTNTFQSFRSALQDFIDGIKEKDCRSKKEYNYKVIDILERGKS